MSKQVQESYLGDGVYISFDEGENDIKLRAPRDREDHEVYLDFTMLTLLIAYARSKGWKIA
jgi:hypothetical protein